MGKYPECEKLSKVSKESNKIGFFLDWLEERGIVLAEYPEHCLSLRSWEKMGEDCKLDHDTREMDCGTGCSDYTPESGDVLQGTHHTKERLLADYYEVDLAEVENERQAMLEECRNANSGGS